MPPLYIPPFRLDPKKMMRTPGINPNAATPGLAPSYEAPPPPQAAPPPVLSKSAPMNEIGSVRPRVAETSPAPMATRPRIAGDTADVAGLSFGVNPNYEVRTAKPKDQFKADARFEPKDYSNDPIGKAERESVNRRHFGPKRGFWSKTGDALKIGLAEMAKVHPGASWQAKLAALGAGTAAGGIVGKASPNAMSSMLFQNYERPALEEKMGREADSRKRSYEEAKQAGDLGLQDARTRTAALQGDNYESSIEDRKADNERQIADSKTREEVAKARILNLQAPPRPVSVAPGGRLVDPVTGKEIFTAPPAAPRPMSVAPGGTVINPQTGERLFTAPERSEPDNTEKRSADVNKDIEGFNKLQEEVKNIGGQIQASTDAVEKAELSATYNSKLGQMNAEAERLRNAHGDDIEDVGQGGWAYFKPRVQRRRSTSGGASSGGGGKTYPASAIAAYAASKNIDEAEARRRLTVSGYTIQ